MDTMTNVCFRSSTMLQNTAPKSRSIYLPTRQCVSRPRLTPICRGLFGGKKAQGKGSAGCSKCKGTGAIQCAGCKGTGRNRANGNVFERWKCYDCQGFGLISCPQCSKGKALTPEQSGER